MRPRILIVGAGFAGSVYARVLADHGCRVCIVEKRGHVGGNAYDEVASDGIRRHVYGPHLFHTANTRVLDFIRRFGAWIPYRHRVRALLGAAHLVPLPINIATINAVFGERLQTAEDAKSHLRRVALDMPHPRNAADYLHSKLGIELTDLFFRPYSKVMWGMDLEDLAPSVVKRVPLNLDAADTYFPSHETQLLPARGYTTFFENLLDHDNIEVNVNTRFEPGMLRDVAHCFASMAIDEFYDDRYGPLPYRSIRFHHRTVGCDDVGDAWTQAEREGVATINFTASRTFTRETAWHLLPGHLRSDTGRRTFTKEEPCAYADNDFERYYPVRSIDSAERRIYEKYADDARADRRIHFIGRCGTYRYLDMDQVISQSLAAATVWIRSNPWR